MSVREYIRTTAKNALIIYDAGDASAAFLYWERRMRGNDETALVLFTSGISAVATAAQKDRKSFEQAMLNFMSQEAAA